MINLFKQTHYKKAVFIEDINELGSYKDLSEKRLCIIKTEFKNLRKLKPIQQKYPDMEIWLCAENIKRKDIILANKYGIKNVIPYPFDLKIINDFFKSKFQKEISETVPEIPVWLKGLKVMIVDDNPMNVELLAQTLANSGLNISTFLNPVDAGIAAEKEKFDLFLLDIMMPDMSGFELAKLIKETEINENAPIMFISALSDSENKITGYNLGSCAYIEKPFDINVVRSQIINTLKTKQLQEAMNNKKESFIAMVTHDLKSPVASEIAALEMLAQNYMRSGCELEKAIVSDLLGASKYMKNLLENVLNKYSFENGDILLNKEIAILDKLIIESLEETKYLMLDKQIRVSYVNKTHNSEIMIDYLEIKRVVHNLLMNAIEYSPKNSEISIELSENERSYVFSIINQNKGIPIENPDEIFNKFVSYANKHKRLGSGLGLYIAKRIIDAHNGTIKIDVSDKNYVRFIFSLPKSSLKNYVK